MVERTRDRGTRDGDYKGMRKLFGVMDMVIIFMAVIVSQLYTSVKTSNCTF